MNSIEPRVVVTGTSWMGGGAGSIETALNRLFAGAIDEITMTVYTIGSGADLVFEWLEQALARGVRVRLVINRLGEQPTDVSTRLKTLTRTYSHFLLYDFVGDNESSLHAKTAVADRSTAVIGSSNMSKRGLLTNHELAVVVEGAAASQAYLVIERLFSSKHVRQVVQRD